MAPVLLTSPEPASSLSEPTARGASIGAYLVAVGATVFAILSQYFLPESIPALWPAYWNFVGGLLIVYGIPILAFSLLVGRAPLRHFAERLRSATVEGLQWYGLLSLLSFFVLFLMVIAYEAVDPAALRLLSRPNPVIQAAQSDPWFWIGFSFVIGAVEETIFRGWIFGYWLERRTPNWLVHATWTSLLFAGVHLYYGTTYGPAAPLVFPTLFLLGFAFAAAMRASGGNLVIVALLHGAHDAAGFLTIISPTAAYIVQYGLIGVGAMVGLVVYLRSASREEHDLAQILPPY